MAKNNGDCSSCRYAGVNTKGSSIAPALTERAARALERAYEAGTANYYCTVYDRPVPSERG